MLYSPIATSEYYPAIDRWTEEALNCYKRDCICKGCEIKELYFKDRECFMKTAVVATVRKIGKPNGIVKKILIED